MTIEKNTEGDQLSKSSPRELLEMSLNHVKGAFREFLNRMDKGEVKMDIEEAEEGWKEVVVYETDET